MIRNYFIVAWRNISRNPAYTTINVFGLALGITCSLVLFLLINFYTSFDNFHADGDRIYRVVYSSDNNGRQDFSAGVPIPLPEAVRNEFSGIEDVLLISGAFDGLFTVDQDSTRRIFEQEEGFGFTDPTFFRFFNRELVSGDYNTALSEPNQILISERIAKRFFGARSAIGEIIRLNNDQELRVTGIMEDFRENTNFPFDMLISYATIKNEKESRGWQSVMSDDQCYLKLEPGVSPADIDRQFPDLARKYEGPDEVDKDTRWLQALSDLGFDERFSNYRYKTMSKSSILAMAVVAIFLIVTACINFVNLSTAVAVKRSKEVGIRKVLGGQRFQLISQYLAETGLITLVALLLAIGFAELTLINLNSFLNLNLHVDFGNQGLFIFIASVWLIVTIISGLYPALLLSGFSPARALKNKITNRSTGGFVLRRGLVVFQFVISQLLIVGTIILLSQMNYIENKNLGFVKDAIIRVPIPANAPLNNQKVLKTNLSQINGVERVSLCSRLPASGAVWSSTFRVQGVDGDFVTQVKLADENYLKLFDIQLLAGNDLPDLDTATTCVVNEKLALTAGFNSGEEMVGSQIRLWGKTMPVVGVVKDFHTVSLAEEIDPTIIFNRLDRYKEIAIKLNGAAINKQTLGQIEKAWEAQYPESLFKYDFLDEEIKEFYDTEQKMSALLLVFSTIAITIGCLGLYGLISFMANEKEKEIGVRKVLGASIGNILFIFSKEFIILIFIAFAIASPLAAHVMGQWLENFAYKIPLNAFMFLTGIGITFLIAFVTVGYRSLRASLANPVDALRSE